MHHTHTRTHTPGHTHCLSHTHHDLSKRFHRVQIADAVIAYTTKHVLGRASICYMTSQSKFLYFSRLFVGIIWGANEPIFHDDMDILKQTFHKHVTIHTCTIHILACMHVCGCE